MNDRISVPIALAHAQVVHPEILLTWIWLRWLNPHHDGTPVNYNIRELAELTGLKVPTVSKRVAWLANRQFIHTWKVNGKNCYTMLGDLPASFFSPVEKQIKKVIDLRRLKQIK